MGWSSPLHRSRRWADFFSDRRAYTTTTAYPGAAAGSKEGNRLRANPQSGIERLIHEQGSGAEGFTAILSRLHFRSFTELTAHPRH